MKPRVIFSLIATSIIALAMTSCCACRQGSPKIGQLEDSKWRLTELDGKQVAKEQSVVLTFNANEKMIYGEAPCNNFFAGYSTVKGETNNIAIGHAGATRKFCPDSEIEDKFVMQLSNIVTIKVESNNLLLLNNEGDLIGILSKE